MNRPTNTRRQAGFTLIELSLAMTFVALLLLAIAMTLIQMTNTYSKGLTLRSVNQTARSLTTELRRDIAEASAFDLAATGASQRYVQYKTATGSGEMVAGGRLCLGTVTYVWNYAEALNSNAAEVARLLNRYDADTPVRFARVNDRGASLCAPGASDPDTLMTNFIRKDDATELLVNNQSVDLALHAPATGSFIEQAAQDKLGAVQQGLYVITLVIGTNEDGVIDTSNQTCRPPGDGVNNYNFCAINVFEIVARAGNQGN